MKRKARGAKARESLGLRLPAELAEWTAVVSERRGVSRNQLITVWLRSLQELSERAAEMERRDSPIGDPLRRLGLLTVQELSRLGLSGDLLLMLMERQREDDAKLRAVLSTAKGR